MACTLYRGSNTTLVPGAGTGSPPRQNFAALGYMALQPFRVFVVGRSYFVRAKHADLAAWRIAAASATSMGRTALGPFGVR
ncbi:MAG: hypothetical protein NVS4B8_11360 [Herpetosiphon sp.]